MRNASKLVLNGFEIRTDTKIVRWPDRYMDPRGERFWQTVFDLIRELTVPDAMSTPPPPYVLEVQPP